ncbi:hypothetical protein [Parvicella tangerina]|uniref:Uncharacterized protein n=1 Tax=Parvicella tangerina TaxID=2829795 RepID=A0A916JR34_9FLAO|nr:hypothetical protein [Parvicella tangerina]CAG5086800.1 hypothetical protein CRYO30217_03285 [Parvicella tangerina]
MKVIIQILCLFICTSFFGQFGIDLEYDYSDFLIGDSTRNYTLVRFYDQKIKEGVETNISLSEELLFDENGNLFERHYLCGKSSCQTMKFEIDQCGVSLLIEDTHDLITIPNTDKRLTEWDNISLKYDNLMRVRSVTYVDSKDVEQLRLEYYYDIEGRIVECKRFYDGILRLITKIEYIK